MARTRLDVLSCVEHERLAFELLEVRTRGQYLTRLRGISREEQAEWDRRERAALAQLVDHELEHAAAIESLCSAEGKLEVALPDTKW
jgi:hypothetical protein